MDDYAGRVLADRYRLPLPPADAYELTETRAFDTYSGQEVLVRQVPLPEVVEAEVLDAEGLPDGFTAREYARPGQHGQHGGPGRAAGAARRPADPTVRRAVEAAQAAARIPDHPRLDQVFDVFAEGGSLWVVSELVAARPLSALLAERSLTPYRAAEVASDVLTALRVLHAHGWVHRNITARTVLVCEDGRVMLTGLAVGAAEEALCGYDPVPAEPEPLPGSGTPAGGAADGGTADGRGPTGPAGGAGGAGHGPGTFGGAAYGAAGSGRAGERGMTAAEAEAARRAAIEARAAGGLPPLSGGGGAPGGSAPGAPAPRALESNGDVRAARAGAIAAYRAGARAAARVQEAQQNGAAALPASRTQGAGPDDPSPSSTPSTPSTFLPYANGRTGQGTDDTATGGTALPPGQIVDPYGVRRPPGAMPPVPPGFELLAPGGHPSAPAGGDPLGPPSGQRNPGAPVPAVPAPHTAPGVPAVPDGCAAPPEGTASRWGGSDAERAGARGPATALAAERARQARMAVVGPVTERWAPEQAGPVHENWQLAAPIGPATDLWALGALLFRAVQGHAPYPEESTADLVQMVCAEPPAFAEECGPLRPVVESLLRQDPTERPDFEELRGWLRSLVRSAPEPEAGTHVVAAPPTDPKRLPIVRRRGELVRRRRAALPAHHGRHKRRETDRSPRSLGRTLLVVILLALAAAVAYAMLFMPKADGGDGTERTGSAGSPTGSAGSPTDSAGGPASASGEPRPDERTQTSPAPRHSGSSAPETQSGAGPAVADGFTLRTDPAGFRIAVADGWDRTPGNGNGQVVYSHSGFTLIVVPGRDSAGRYGSDPMTYQREKESELQPYRNSSWATASGLRTTTVGGRTMAEGQFTWTGGDGRELFVRNLAILLGGRYHVVQVRGPEAERDEVTRLYEQASATYEYTG
ncbi:protein kinase [Streptomyces sp. bgisy159]|uniref:protein kinase n=1 Tax=Streptomyces sp. bgisy159 TaxID=3413795 RepID=UPI003F4A4A68